MMKKSETMNKDELIQLSKGYDSMYWHNATNKAARLVIKKLPLPKINIFNCFLKLGIRELSRNTRQYIDR
jgi:hypothetical protein